MSTITRDHVLMTIEQNMRVVEEIKLLLATIVEKLASSPLTEDEILNLESEKEDLEEDLSELYKDIAISEESLHILEINLTQDERSCSPYEEHYEPAEEVFTAGDY